MAVVDIAFHPEAIAMASVERFRDFLFQIAIDSVHKDFQKKNYLVDKDFRVCDFKLFGTTTSLLPIGSIKQDKPKAYYDIQNEKEAQQENKMEVEEEAPEDVGGEDPGKTP